MIDSKRRDFGCFGLANGERTTPKKKKREQAPALHMQFYTGLIVPGNMGKSRKT
jgi:hypothetical protein